MSITPFNNHYILEFLTKEIAFHTELPDMFRCDLKLHADDKLFWEELLNEFEKLGVYCFTICDVCGRPMIEGYSMTGSHYCSDDCLHNDFTEEQVKNLCTDDNDEHYYTTWFENSIVYQQSRIYKKIL